MGDARRFACARSPRSHSAAIRVNSTDDTDLRDGAITLREAMLLATGKLSLSALTPEERNQVLRHPLCGSPAWSDCPGAGSPDSVVFDTDIFPVSSPAAIQLQGALPFLDSGNGSKAGK